jgi:hypothetical protein
MKKLLPLLLFAAGLMTLLMPSATFSQTSSVSRLLDRYYAVKVALTRDNFDSARMASTEFAAAAQTSDVKGAAKLAATVKKAGSASNIEALRKAFKPVSNDMIALVTKYHAKSDAPAYVQYCPMVNAYWLSADEQVRNPYYGKKMLFCGQTQRTIQ